MPKADLMEKRTSWLFGSELKLFFCWEIYIYADKPAITVRYICYVTIECYHRIGKLLSSEYIRIYVTNK